MGVFSVEVRVYRFVAKFQGLGSPETPQGIRNTPKKRSNPEATGALKPEALNPNPKKPSNLGSPGPNSRILNRER